MKTSVYQLLIAIALIFGITTIQAQDKPKYNKSTAEMNSAVIKYLKAQPQAQQYYKTNNSLRMDYPGLWTDIYALRKAYDLNPNDLSLKAQNPGKNVILILFPLVGPIGKAKRLPNDAMRVPAVRQALEKSVPKGFASDYAAFILVENKLGNFEIQDLMSR